MNTAYQSLCARLMMAGVPDARFDAAELNQRRIEHLKRRVGAEHQRAAQIDRTLRHSRRNAAADGNKHAQSHIDGRNRGEQAASFISAVLLTYITGGGGTAAVSWCWSG